MSTTAKLPDLSVLNSEDFESVVNQDVRGQLDDHSAAALRLPENVFRWYNTLNSLKKNVEAQFTTKRAELHEKMSSVERDSSDWLKLLAEYERWKAGAIRFKAGVENRIAEAKILRTTVSNEDTLAKLANDLRRTRQQRDLLMSAIHAHKAAEDADEADEELYKVLETV